MADMTDAELLAALGVEAEPKKKVARSPREERIIAGFEEIQRFVEEHGHAPQHGEDRDIFERIYATRLDQIRRQKECRELVSEFDHQGLLGTETVELEGDTESLDDEELLAQLGVEAVADNDITQLKHVKPRAEIRAAEEIASRTKCEDFDKFAPIFEAVQKELDSGYRVTKPFQEKADVRPGDLYILSGQKVLVAEVGEEFVTDYNRRDCRLRVIYDNGTESDILLRSLQRALHKDPAGRRIIETAAGPLFEDEADTDDTASGTIYVLRSQSDHPMVAKNREIIHKIGVTGGDVKKRIANAENDPTFLLAPVEIVATYELYNINRVKLEKLLHRFFESARLDIQIKDRFGKPVVPREWFFVPMFVVDQVVEKLREGSLGDFYYDLDSASLRMTQE
ncbi:MAG TPA: hypothetical protein DCF95_03820 [Gammaproteobacteria bacterium]|uniref:GIY-YIG nuclease family protein n=1 Tax=Spongiibacter sp. TaxID=2024860 RepID=UPI000C4D0BF6|nr:GIY-YIG nuclease family protein [Spongiibacter sp.]MAY40620.1 hypothetical protein [Spongiibacter sp.]MBI59526.1 hypothetical protein [Spongiibacter sp.]HAC87052.1 hypothetical protein [Gammaproteobacteria bacterium]|tara:strand:- start:4598 stop:5785 length:1188 start_codon:yes stop_codon:yes gene_type:complete